MLPLVPEASLGVMHSKLLQSFFKQNMTLLNFDVNNIMLGTIPDSHIIESTISFCVFSNNVLKSVPATAMGG